MLEGRVAIVTGAGQGLGKAIAESLAAKGAAVAVVDIRLDTARAVASAIVRSGGRALPVLADVSKVGDIEAMVAATVGEFGGIDILVNNAGILHSTPIEDITEGEWDHMMAVNLKSVFFCIQRVLSHMRKRKGGRIISISSLAGRMGGVANGVGYSASKAAIIGLTRAVARRVADSNITVNAIAPGTTETDIIKAFSAEQIEGLRQAIPLKRLGRPENVSELVAFLCTEAADFITGAVIDVNGGMYMG